VSYSAVLDTCVLHPAYLRDTLLRLAAADLFMPIWSHEILDELSNSLAPLMGEHSVDRIIARMAIAFPDALISGHGPLVPTMMNHPKDRHVLAAAVHASAVAVVTFNLSDFPADATEPFGIDVIHPDAFLLDLLDLAPHTCVSALRRQVAGYRRPTMSIGHLAAALGRCGCPRAANDLRRRIEQP
jgi:predicted nucleic acid-binding protein